MKECICSTCGNLKTYVDEDALEGDGIYESCEFGYPEETCEACNVDGCDLTCSNYVTELLTEGVKTVPCSICGTQVETATQNDHAEVFCVSCYLKK